MNWYIADFNGMLTDLKEKVKSHLVSPRDANVWVVWQDIRGSYGDLIKASYTTGWHKPTYVVQHGAMATRDYDSPNNMKLQADRFLCWGKNDYERMCKLGYGDKTTIVGCPLNRYIVPRVQHSEKVVLFVPVNTGKEEPENIAAYYELLKIKYDEAKLIVLHNRGQLKDKWGFNGKLNVSFNELSANFDVVAKLLPWHDKSLYHGNTVSGYQDSPKNNHLLFNLLRNVDMVVGLDEGTTEAFAFGHDVPVITVDGFKYRQFKDDGRQFEVQDIARSKASTHVSLGCLREAIQYGLAHPEHKKQERYEAAENLLGISAGDATDNIFKVIREEN